jgi:glutaredoxin
MAQETASGSAAPEIRAFWQPGCTSCLRMKEFLQRHGVPFTSVNVLEEKGAMAELAALGVRTVPIIRRGSEWANGQVLRDVARVAGIPYGGTKIHPPAELMRRLGEIQGAARRFLGQLPDEKLNNLLPNRPRTYAQLSYHIFNIADAWLEHEVDGAPLKEGAYNRVPPPEMDTKAKVLAYGEDVQRRLDDWWSAKGATTNFQDKASVYYGDQSKHEFLERTTWHSGQHVRQYRLVLETLGITPDRPLPEEIWEGLPMPVKVWDDEKPFAA